MNPWEDKQYPEYAGIESALKYLLEAVTDIKRETLDIKQRLDMRAYTVKEIAEGLGCSVSNLKSRPWLLPNYGRPDFGSSPGKWFYNSLMNWWAIPEDERRFKWETMSAAERRKRLGIHLKEEHAV
jgi:hypothetical protein